MRNSTRVGLLARSSSNSANKARSHMASISRTNRPRGNTWASTKDSRKGSSSKIINHKASTWASNKRA
jgi:hypothetical protein